MYFIICENHQPGTALEPVICFHFAASTSPLCVSHCSPSPTFFQRQFYNNLFSFKILILEKFLDNFSIYISFSLLLSQTEIQSELTSPPSHCSSLALLIAIPVLPDLNSLDSVPKSSENLVSFSLVGKLFLHL